MRSIQISTLRRIIRESLSDELHDVIEDKEFKFAMRGLGDIADRLKKYDRNQIMGIFKDLGPEGEQGTKTWAYVISMMASYGSDDFLEDDMYMLGAAKPWLATSLQDRKALVERAKKLIVEHNKNNPKKIDKPEAPEDAPLEQYAFADQRPDAPDEPNTAAEEKLRQSLGQHFVDNIPLDQHASEEIRQFVSKGEYKSVFHAPKQQQVYRGMAVNIEWMLDALKISEEELKKHKDGEVEKTFTFSPREKEGASSWTISSAVAEDFSFDKSYPYEIVLTANVSDNPGKFVTGPDGLYDISGFDNFTSEEEVIGLGDIKVCKISWNRGK